MLQPNCKTTKHSDTTNVLVIHKNPIFHQPTLPPMYSHLPWYWRLKLQKSNWHQLSLMIFFPRKHSGQIMIFHQPRFPWNKGIPLTKPPFGVRSCEVAIIWPQHCKTLLFSHSNLVLWDEYQAIPFCRKTAEASKAPSRCPSPAIQCWCPINTDKI